MPWRNSTSYTFSQSSVVLNAPQQSGVYALYYKTRWVYVGESENIRAQLLTRAWRQDELVREFRPICNPWLG